ERVRIVHALDVTARARIAVPVPRASDAAGRLVDARGQTESAQSMEHVESRESGADDDRVELRGRRRGRVRRSIHRPARTTRPAPATSWVSGRRPSQITGVPLTTDHWMPLARDTYRGPPSGMSLTISSS